METNSGILEGVAREMVEEETSNKEVDEMVRVMVMVVLCQILGGGGDQDGGSRRDRDGSRGGNRNGGSRGNGNVIGIIGI